MFKTKYFTCVSHVVGVVIEHMEKLGKEHWKWVLRYLRHTSMTYSVCSDLVYGYVDSKEGSGPYWSKLCRHVHATIIVREAIVVLGFSWLANKVMNESGKGIK
jgi:hypothetical protein